MAEEPHLESIIVSTSDEQMDDWPLPGLNSIVISTTAEILDDRPLPGLNSITVSLTNPEAVPPETIKMETAILELDGTDSIKYPRLDIALLELDGPPSVPKYPRLDVLILEFDDMGPPPSNPDTPDLTSVSITQVDADPKGRTQVTVNWDALAPNPEYYCLYRIPGNFPVLEGADRDTVLAHGSVVTVSETIPGTATQYVDTLASGLNGTDQTYYLFAYQAGYYSLACDGAYIELLPSIPQNLGKQTDENKVVLSWDASVDTNVNGYNVYRCTGAWVAADAVRVNSILIPKGAGTVTFDDSEDNVTNRRPSGEVPYPVNGATYTYKVEAVDTDSTWDDGTANQSSGVPEDVTADKADIPPEPTVGAAWSFAGSLDNRFYNTTPMFSVDQAKLIMCAQGNSTGNTHLYCLDPSDGSLHTDWVTNPRSFINYTYQTLCLHTQPALDSFAWEYYTGPGVYNLERYKVSDGTPVVVAWTRNWGGGASMPDIPTVNGFFATDGYQNAGTKYAYRIDYTSGYNSVSPLIVGPEYNTPVVYHDTGSGKYWVVVCAQNQYMYRFTVDGSSIVRDYSAWVATGVNFCGGMAAFPNGDVVFAGDDGKVYRRDISDGSEVWTTDALGSPTADFSSFRVGPVIGPSQEVYVVSADGVLFRVSSAGDLDWEVDLTPAGTDEGYCRCHSSPVVLDDGSVVVAIYHRVSGVWYSKVIGVWRANGKIWWTYAWPHTDQIVLAGIRSDSNGNLIVGSGFSASSASGSALKKITISSASGTAGFWPQKGKDPQSSCYFGDI